MSTYRWINALNSFLNVEALVGAFNQEKALVGAFSVITNLRMELFEALVCSADALFQAICYQLII